MCIRVPKFAVMQSLVAENQAASQSTPSSQITTLYSIAYYKKCTIYYKSVCAMTKSAAAVTKDEMALLTLITPYSLATHSTQRMCKLLSYIPVIPYQTFKPS